MAEVTAPARRSNVDRFPVIGKHLIDEATPAYAPTQPPVVVRADPHVSVDPEHCPRLRHIASAMRIAAWAVMALCVGLPLAMAVSWALLLRLPS